MKALEITGLVAGYAQKTILQEVSCTVQSGELVGIIGPNGAGKSTLLKTLRGLLPRQAGSVKIFGRELADFNEKELAQRVAYLQQQVELSFGYTAKDMVAAGRYPYLKWWEQESAKDERLIEQCLRYTGMYEYLDTPLEQMSGGQRQRVLLAKVLAQQTPLLFLDEPTTGLDIVYQEDIFRFCGALAQSGKTILMVVHDLNLAYKYCSRLLLVAGGGILADGRPNEVICEDCLSAAYQTPLKVFLNEHTGGVDIVSADTVLGQQERAALLKEICE